MKRYKRIITAQDGREFAFEYDDESEIVIDDAWGTGYTFSDEDRQTYIDSSSEKLNGRKARRVCENVLDLLAGINIGRLLPKEDIDTMKISFTQAKEYLDDAQPWSAKEAINAITPDGTLITQEIKDKILLEFSESGLPGL